LNRDVSRHWRTQKSQLRNASRSAWRAREIASSSSHSRAFLRSTWIFRLSKVHLCPNAVWYSWWMPHAAAVHHETTPLIELKLRESSPDMSQLPLSAFSCILRVRRHPSKLVMQHLRSQSCGDSTYSAPVAPLPVPRVRP
jgi:hypothetical protein